MSARADEVLAAAYAEFEGDEMSADLAAGFAERQVARLRAAVGGGPVVIMEDGTLWWSIEGHDEGDGIRSLWVRPVVESSAAAPEDEGREGWVMVPCPAGCEDGDCPHCDDGSEDTCPLCRYTGLCLVCEGSGEMLAPPEDARYLAPAPAVPSTPEGPAVDGCPRTSDGRHLWRSLCLACGMRLPHTPDTPRGTCDNLAACTALGPCGECYGPVTSPSPSGDGNEDVQSSFPSSESVSSDVAAEPAPADDTAWWADGPRKAAAEGAATCTDGSGVVRLRGEPWWRTDPCPGGGPSCGPSCGSGGT